MRFTLVQLEAFYWIAHLGSFQDAARELNLAQPTISLRIRKLEEALGVRLFERLGRNVRLTNQGEGLLDTAAAVLGEARKITERHGSADAVRGVLRLGLPENFAIVGLPELMRTLGRDYGNLRIELSIALSSTLSDDLENRHIDAAMVVNPQEHPRLRLVLLGEHEVVWVAHPDIELKPPMRPADVRSMPIIVNPHPSPQYAMVMEWFRNAGVTPPRFILCTSATVTTELVVAGVGISLLPRPLVQPRIDAGQLAIVPARAAPAPARVYVSYRASEGGALIDAIVRSIKEVLQRVPFLSTR